MTRFDYSAAPSPEELAGFPLNDLGNAMRLIRLVGGTLGDDGQVDASRCELLYLRNRGWIGFNGRFWDLNDGEALARKRAHQVSGGIVAQGPFFDERGLKWFDFATKSGSAGASSAMLTQAQSYLVVDLEAFDPDPMALNVANGVLRFRNVGGKPRCEFTPGHVPDDRMTRITESRYDPGTDRPLFDDLLKRSQPDEDRQVYLSQIFGYCATGSTEEQLFFMLQGKGRDGKSTLVNAMNYVLGTYAGVAAVETFLDTGLKRSADASPDIARLAGDTRLICVAEPPRGAKLASGMVKAFTGGGKITARELSKGIFEFQPQGAVVMECNAKPLIPDTDNGIWRRIRVVKFDWPIPEDREDKKFPAKLRREASGMLDWVIAGVLSWMEHGMLTPASVLATIDDYRRGSNPFSDWWADEIVIDKSVRVLASDLYRAYKTWCDDQGHDRPMTQATFGRTLGDLDVESAGKDGGGRKLRRGARLRTAAERSSPVFEATPFDPEAEPSEFERDR